jgi:magnesium chelatase family protein
MPARLVTYPRDYHPVEPYPTVFDLDADLPARAADFMGIKGQEHIKRALEVAAAGGQNVSCVG